ncbi:uncharacterized protein ACBT44_014616 [Syngnathus typhle]
MQSALPSTQPSPTWKKRLVREIAVCGLQFCIQHHCTTTTYLQTRQTGTQYLPLQLATGLPLSEASSSTCWRQYLKQHHTEHGGPPRLRTQSAALHPADAWLHCNLQQQPHSEIADNTTLVGLITKGDETQYRLEVDLLTTWCRDNISKTKEIVVDFRKDHTQHLPLTIDGAVVERVSSTRFLGVHISEDLSWTTNTASLAKKAQRRLYFLRKLRRASAPPAIMTTFYRGTIESVLSSCIAVWGGSCTEYNMKALQRIVNTACKNIGASLPSLKDIYSSHFTRKATAIVCDVSHPAHCLFDLLPSGKRYRSLRSRTTRLTNSFILQTVRILNSPPPSTLSCITSWPFGPRWLPCTTPLALLLLYFCAIILTVCCMYNCSISTMLILFIHCSYLFIVCAFLFLLFVLFT